MRSLAARGTIVALAFLWLPIVGAQAGEQRQRWWHDAKMKAELALTAEQSAQVESVFQAALPRLRSAKKQLDALEADLSRVIRERTTDESEVAQLIDEVESARSALSKERTLMLYRIHRILTPDQNTRLKELHERREREPSTRDRKP
jgi:Spy/CpxP family protein refolding chaperone